MPFTATCMDLELIVLSEVSQAERKIHAIAYMCKSKTNGINDENNTQILYHLP